MAKNQPQTQKPVKMFRRGTVAVSIWEKEHEGKKFFSITPSRSFKRDDDGEWEYSDSFNTDDLPTLARLCDMAFAWIVNQTGKE